jgi:Mlc titration factor MtfA (ptsG expression regulator)
MTGESHPTYGYMGFVRGVLEAQASAAVLRAEMDRMSKKPMLSPAKAALKEALWDGWYLLHSQSVDKAGEALSRGQILLCWDGTTALNYEVAA